jgi:hypothetical protein
MRSSRFLAAAFVLASFAPARAAEPDKDGWIRLFNGKDLSGWKFRNAGQAGNWSVVDAVQPDPANPTKLIPTVYDGPDRPELKVLLCKAVSSDILTEAEFGDYQLHLEFMVPKGSNSGVYNRGLWEVQILDSFGKAALDFGDCGSLYGRRVSPINAARAPGQWQSFDITVKGFEMTVVWNGTKIHESFDIRWTQLKSKADYDRIVADGKAAADPVVFAAANAEAEAAAKAYERAVELSKAGVLGKLEFDRIKATRDAATARRRALSDARAAKLEERNGTFYKWSGEGPTTAGIGRKDTGRGPILLQGDHGDVAFRDLRLRPLK